jgi:hypothetical protein
MSRRFDVVRSFFDDFLQDVPIQRQIGHQPLQSGVLVPQLPELADLKQPQVAVALLPDIERRLADTHLPAHVRHRLSGGHWLEGKQDLLHSESRSLHRSLSLPSKDPGGALLQF